MIVPHWTPRASRPSKPDPDRSAADLLALETVMLRLPWHTGFAPGSSSPRSRTSLGRAQPLHPTQLQWSLTERKGRGPPCPAAAELLCTSGSGADAGSQPPWEHEDSARCERCPAKSSYFQLSTATAASSTRTVWTESSPQQNPACGTRARREPQT